MFNADTSKRSVTIKFNTRRPVCYFRLDCVGEQGESRSRGEIVLVQRMGDEQFCFIWVFDGDAI